MLHRTCGPQQMPVIVGIRRVLSGLLQIVAAIGHACPSSSRIVPALFWNYFQPPFLIMPLYELTVVYRRKVSQSCRRLALSWLL